jgi:hypothetical protein
MENHRMLGTEGAVVLGTEGEPGPSGVPNTTAAAEAARGSDPRTGANGQGWPDPAVLEKPVRRRFAAEYKARILRAADQVTEPGQLGALLRREGLYSSHLSVWRKQRDEAAIAGLGPKWRGRKPEACAERDTSGLPSRR